jgi:hypothetical protein
LDVSIVGSYNLQMCNLPSVNIYTPYKRMYLYNFSSCSLYDRSVIRQRFPNPTQLMIPFSSLFMYKQYTQLLLSQRILLGFEALYFLPTSRWFLTCLTLQPWRCKRHVSPNYRLAFNWLHNVISQNTSLVYVNNTKILEMLSHFQIQSNQSAWRPTIYLSSSKWPVELLPMGLGGIPHFENLCIKRKPQRSTILISPYSPDRVCGPPSLLYNGYGGGESKAAGVWTWPLTSN